MRPSSTCDAEIRSVFEEDRLLTPDDVRGDAATLREAVTTTGWPKLGDVRGQVMLFMDNGGDLHDLYLTGHPSLEGRALFTSAAEDGDDDEAVVKVNDPAEAPRITRLVNDGFFVRTHADADLTEAQTNDTTDREITLRSGAQVVSTDFPIAEPAANGYVVAFPAGPQVRCNPVLVTGAPDGLPRTRGLTLAQSTYELEPVRRRHPDAANVPPSRCSVVPVTNRAMSPARNTMAAAASSTEPMRPVGVGS